MEDKWVDNLCKAGDKIDISPNFDIVRRLKQFGISLRRWFPSGVV
jgi:hypothetical protein